MAYVLCTQCGDNVLQEKLDKHLQTKKCAETRQARLGREPVTAVHEVSLIDKPPGKWNCCGLDYEDFKSYFRHKLAAHTVRIADKTYAAGAGE